MNALALHEWHEKRRARFSDVNGQEMVLDYGDWAAEHEALMATAAVLDLSCRGRLCVVGSDRVRFLHGQVTNDIQRLGEGEGCYAALVTAKGRMESDLHVYRLKDELLLDLEPGMGPQVAQRLQKYIVADDTDVVDVSGLYGLASVQGPAAEAVVAGLNLFASLPGRPLQTAHARQGESEIYVANHPRAGAAGFDLFAPANVLESLMERLQARARALGGRLAGWQALETARIQFGIPRFRADMDGSNLPLECGIEERAISYNKGCYIGQEVINRVHTMGHVNRELRHLRLSREIPEVPGKGAVLFAGENEAGHVTSAARIPAGDVFAIGYVRRQFLSERELAVVTSAGRFPAKVVQRSPQDSPPA